MGPLNQADFPPPLLLPFLFSVMLCCCKNVKGLPSRYLLFAELGAHAIAVYFYFFPSRHDFRFQLDNEFC